MTYLLDTNIASDAIKGEPARVRKRLVSLPMREVMISAVTQGELIYGLAKRGYPAALNALILDAVLKLDSVRWIHS